MSRRGDRAGLGVVLLNIGFVLLGFAATSARAQTSVDGAISGIVTDSSGAAIADATVQTKDIATGLTVTTTSDGNGEFLVPRLPASEYELTARAPGFSPLPHRQVLVELRAVNGVQLKLQIIVATTPNTLTATPMPSPPQHSATSSTQ